MSESREHEPFAENKEQTIIKLLKEKGIDDPEARDMLITWVQEQEQIAERSEGNEAYILLEFRKARLYLEAGFEEQACESFNAARRMAAQEGQADLLGKIDGDMDKALEK